MKLVDVGAAQIAVQQQGDGPLPFVFIHGWAADGSVWLHQFEDISRDHTCVLPDLRGRGRSSHALPCDISTAADDVSVVLRTLDLGPAIIVGHGLGGQVALVMNTRYPELVLGIVTGDTSMGNFALAKERDESLAASIQGAGEVRAAEKLIEASFLRGCSPDVLPQVRDMMLDCPTDIAVGMLDNASLDEQWDDMVRNADKKPFMALWAEHPLGDPNRLREITVFLRQEPIAGAGHFFQLERPNITNALLRAFVDDVRRDPRVATD